ncbi:MAG: hypothetical protein NMNS01_25840 [Nitrosomonas sp.]|nr:MAG: hypothetical protein NMNS01_25840 [Nitrosomonas sp.]
MMKNVQHKRYGLLIIPGIATDCLVYFVYPGITIIKLWNWNMDNELNKAFEKSQQELTHLYYRWIMYVQIFGTNTHRIDLVNQTASNFLIEFQWLVIDNMVLALSKFTDPVRMRGNDNLSFPYLIEHIKKTDKNEIVDDLKQTLKDLNETTKHFRDIRNKRIAHNDMAVSLDSDESPLPGVSRADVNAALKVAGDFLNKIELAYLNSTTAYELTILPLNNDGCSLLKKQN